MTRRSALLAALLAAAALAACGGSPSPGTTSSTGTDAAPRPSSPAQVMITSPANGAVVTGGKVHITVTVTGAQVVQNTSQTISPTQGHVHLLLDGGLTYMSYTLSEDLPVTHAGNYTLRAEFVASDHVPFNPAVVSQTVLFTVPAG